MATLASDTFDRPDGALNLSTADSGQRWAATTTSTSTSNANVVGNRLLMSGDGAWAQLPRDPSARSLAATVRATGASWSGLLRLHLASRGAGGSSTNGCCYLQVTASGVALYAASTVGGTASIVGASHPWGPAVPGVDTEIEAWLDPDGYVQIRFDGLHIAAEPLSPAQIMTFSAATHSGIYLSSSGSSFSINNFGATDFGAPLWTPWPPPEPAAGNLIWWDEFRRPNGNLRYSTPDCGIGEWETNEVNDIAVRSERMIHTSPSVRAGVVHPGGVRYAALTVRSTLPTAWRVMHFAPWAYNTTSDAGALEIYWSGSSIGIRAAGSPGSSPSTVGTGHSHAVADPAVDHLFEAFIVGNVIYVRIDGTTICGEPLSPSQLANTLGATATYVRASTGTAGWSIDSIVVTDEGPTPMPDPGGGSSGSGWVIGLPF